MFKHKKKKHNYTKILEDTSIIFYSLYTNNLLLKRIFLISPLLIILIANDMELTK